MDTKIKLNDGSNKWLSNVRIGDILDGSIKVVGVVSVLPNDLKIFKVIVDNNVLIGGTNIQMEAVDHIMAKKNA